jgi:hypothetical protein
MRRLIPALVILVLSLAAGCAPTSGWTCAAFCLTEASCSSGGESTWRMNPLQGAGQTAAAAYGQLVKACPAAGSLVAHARCSKGALEIAAAPLAAVCGHN